MLVHMQFDSFGTTLDETVHAKSAMLLLQLKLNYLHKYQKAVSIDAANCERCDNKKSTAVQSAFCSSKFLSSIILNIHNSLKPQDKPLLPLIITGKCNKTLQYIFRLKSHQKHEGHWSKWKLGSMQTANNQILFEQDFRIESVKARKLNRWK